jgi:DNA ligase-1
MRREFLQLAETFNPDKVVRNGNFAHCVSNRFLSEKLDGTRCFWDGGLSRGMPTEEVPWASIIDPKTGQRKAKIKPIATGLWSRYGNPIMAPDWFLNQLPSCLLDGELWRGRGKFQECRSICGGDEPDPRFDQISYAVYSSPPLTAIFGSGEIKNTNMVAQFTYEKMEQWVKQQAVDFEGDFRFLQPNSTFAEELKFLSEAIEAQSDHCFLHKQLLLPDDEMAARGMVDRHLDEILTLGGEGVVLRDPRSIWTPKRHSGILKWKPYNDAEGVVTGFTSGRETLKGSRLQGMIGALIVSYNAKRLELAGLTDAEREFQTSGMSIYAAQHPGVDMPANFQGKCFRVGQVVTFKYRELSDDKIPKEARFWRGRAAE